MHREEREGKERRERRMPQPPKAQNGVGEIVEKIMFKHTLSSRFRSLVPVKKTVKNNPACLWLLASCFCAATFRHGEGKRGVAQGGGRREPASARPTCLRLPASQDSRLPPPPNPVQTLLGGRLRLHRVRHKGGMGKGKLSCSLN